MYLLSVLALILCFVLAGLAQPSLRPYQFFDGMSILVLLILIFSVMISAGLLRDLNNAFGLVFGKKKEAALLTIKRAKLAVDTVIKAALYSSVFAAVMLIVVLLHNLADPAYLGPAISTALLTLLYAMVISLLLLPIRAKLEQQILEYMPSCAEREEEEKQGQEGDAGC